MKIVENHEGTRITHEFEPMTPEKRPQDEAGDGSGLRFQTLEQGGACPDTMPQALLVTDLQGRSCTYAPAKQSVIEKYRPQDPTLDGSELRFETMNHGGEYPDKMPQLVRVSDPEGRTCDYVPITVDGRVFR